MGKTPKFLINRWGVFLDDKRLYTYTNPEGARTHAKELIDMYGVSFYVDRLSLDEYYDNIRDRSE